MTWLIVLPAFTCGLSLGVAWMCASPGHRDLCVINLVFAAANAGLLAFNWPWSG